ncbi:unnamed protein product [Symbiodinium natans]|uniref:Uncharacterized protein n=1 Tax=Symbiodinium natans TaxID=878477 RepID=A0A812LVX7_9DINO|nr:unnamed protein product [Symbiodinium natans]
MLVESRARETQQKDSREQALKKDAEKLRAAERDLEAKKAELQQRETDFELATQARKAELQKRETELERRVQDKEQELQKRALQQRAHEQELQKRERAVAEQERDLESRRHPAPAAGTPGTQKRTQEAKPGREMQAVSSQPATPEVPPAQVKRRKRAPSGFKSQDEARWTWYQHSKDKLSRSGATAQQLAASETSREAREAKVRRVLPRDAGLQHFASSTGEAEQAAAPAQANHATLDLHEWLDAVSKGLDPEVEQTKRVHHIQESTGGNQIGEGGEEVSEPDADAPEEIDWSCDEVEEGEALPTRAPDLAPSPPSPAPSQVQPPMPGPKQAEVRETSPLPHTGSAACTDASDVPAQEPTEEFADAAATEAQEAPEAAMTARQKKREWFQQKFPTLSGKGTSKGAPVKAASAPAERKPPLPRLGRLRPPPARRLIPKEEWAYQPLPTRRVAQAFSNMLLKELARLNQLPDVNSLLPPL